MQDAREQLGRANRVGEAVVERREAEPEEVGRVRLEKLVEHAVHERFVYRHKWTPGDLLMWDNRCLLHRASTNFDAARFPRVLQRTCLRGTAPA